MSLYGFSAVGNKLGRADAVDSNMLRRGLLKILAAIPVSTRLTRLHGHSTLKDNLRDERSPRFWLYFHQAARRGVAMSTERSRDAAVSELQLTILTDREAREALRRAADGTYTTSVIPSPWRELFRDLDQAYSLERTH